jgi:uncharacterized membrane protein
MDLRLKIDELAERHQLSHDAAARLTALADLDAEPPSLHTVLPKGLAIVAAVLAGLGVIFWVAANWSLLSRAGQFALLECVVATMCLGAWFAPAARTALALLALLAIGGLFAYFGQTYQTGADAWQLFALWAVLGLPLCLGLRHDALWTPWAIICMTAISLWIYAHAGRGWNVRASDLPYHLAGWSAALLLVLALSPGLRRHTGAGMWSMRVTGTLAVCTITWTGLMSLFDTSVAPQFPLGLALLAAAAMTLSSTRLHDTFALSAVGFALNVLLVGGLAHMLLNGARGDLIFPVILIGLLAAAMLAATVHMVMSAARKHAPGATA